MFKNACLAKTDEWISLQFGQYSLEVKVVLYTNFLVHFQRSGK